MALAVGLETETFVIVNAEHVVVTASYIVIHRNFVVMLLPSKRFINGDIGFETSNSTC